MRTEVLCISVLRVASGHRVKLASRKSDLANTRASIVIFRSFFFKNII